MLRSGPGSELVIGQDLGDVIAANCKCMIRKALSPGWWFYNRGIHYLPAHRIAYKLVINSKPLLSSVLGCKCAGAPHRCAPFMAPMHNTGTIPLRIGPRNASTTALRYAPPPFAPGHSIATSDVLASGFSGDGDSRIHASRYQRHPATKSGSLLCLESCRTNAVRAEHAACSSGLRCPRRSPSPAESVRRERD